MQRMKRVFQCPNPGGLEKKKKSVKQPLGTWRPLMTTTMVHI